MMHFISKATPTNYTDYSCHTKAVELAYSQGTYENNLGLVTSIVQLLMDLFSNLIKKGAKRRIK